MIHARNTHELMDGAPHHEAAKSSPTPEEDVLAPRLRQIVDSALEAIESADHIAITLVDGEAPLIATSTEARQLELAQRSDVEGPTLHSLQRGEVARVITIAAGPWPDFREVCRNHGIGSVAAFPILAEVGDDGDASDDIPIIGVLTVYSEDHHAFGATELRIGKAAANQAGRVLVAGSVTSADPGSIEEARETHR